MQIQFYYRVKKWNYVFTDAITAVNKSLQISYNTSITKYLMIFNIYIFSISQNFDYMDLE